jgi:hypothetical protein
MGELPPPILYATENKCVIKSAHDNIRVLGYLDVPGANQYNRGERMCELYTNLICREYGKHSYTCDHSRDMAAQALQWSKEHT